MRFLTAILLLTASVTAGADHLPNFDAWYTTTKYGLSAAKTHTVYRRTPDNNYSYTSTSETSGMVSIFRSDIIREGSVGKIVDGHYRPDRYYFTHTRGSKTKKHFSLRYLWNKHQVVSNVMGNYTTYALPEKTIDRFVLQVAIMHAMQKKPRSLTYTLVDKYKLKQWTFKVSGRESIKVPAGTFETIKLVRQHGVKKRTTWLYVAPALNNLPVRITFVERDGSKFSMELTKYSGLKQL